MAHNDLPTISKSTAKITTYLAQEDVAKLRGLFEKLWAVLTAAHIEILNTAIVEPTFGSLEMHPVQVLRQLKWAMIQANQFESGAENGQSEESNFEQFEFAGVGEEKLLRLIGKDKPG